MPRSIHLSSKRLVVACLAVILLFAATFLAYTWSESVGIDNLRDDAMRRLDLYVTGMESTLGKYDYLPRTLELNGDIIELLGNPGNPTLVASVNRYLAQVNELAGSLAVYVLDLNGVALASSNWNDEVSFVGVDLSYRPYFQDAMRLVPGRFYGIGTTSREAGYFFAHGVHRNGKLLGAAAVKVSLERLEKTWAQGAEMVLLADENGVIFLTSEPAWKFKTLGPLPGKLAERLNATRQYFEQRLEPIQMVNEKNIGPGARIVSVPVRATLPTRPGITQPMFLAQSRTMSQQGWQFIILSDLAPVKVMARNAAAIAGFACGFLLLLLLYAQQRRRTIAQRLVAKEALQRAHDDLERKVAWRTKDLSDANLSLQHEIAERERTEHVLRDAHNELVQAGKMAVLGQMSAGITHELNQPLTALRTLSDNAMVFLRRGQIGEVESNLATVSQLIDRMGKIIGQLKAFARKTPAQLASVSVRRVVFDALFLVERRLRLEDVEFEHDIPEDEILALCDSNRLQQVLVNLFNNALDAMSDSSLRYLSVQVCKEKDKVLISVRDSGPGIPDEILAHLFEPFFTTKKQGAGLGLGLVISAEIVREFGGLLQGSNFSDGGAEFIVTLRSAENP